MQTLLLTVECLSLGRKKKIYFGFVIFTSFPSSPSSFKYKKKKKMLICLINNNRMQLQNIL